MRLLADENIPRSIILTLRNSGHDVLWARVDLAGVSDTDILELAESQDRIVLTLDKVFWQIALQRRNPLVRSGVVLLRVHPAIPNTLMPLVHAFLQNENGWTGHVSIIAPDGIQMITSGTR